MLSENIILQSAGSLSVAILALLMLILQTIFFFRKPQFTWYAWSAAISFSALLYSVGIFLEYNTLEGPLNRFSGLLEYTAIICLIHCLYGFTFSYLGIESKRYHPVAGVCHGLILILLWFTNYIVAESFTTRNFIGLESPYIEPALGPLGPVFVLYAAVAGVNAMIIWIKHKGTDPKHRIVFLVGMGFWFLLGIHDGLASLGVPTFQYVMEYGFLGFAMVILWVVFSNYLEIAAEEKYRVITEFANDCILVIQDEKMVFENPACCDLMGRPLTDSEPRDFLDIMASEDRKTVFEHFNTLLEGGRVHNPHTVRIRRADGERRFVEIASSVIRYRNRSAVLAIMRDMTERKQAEEALKESEKRFRDISYSMADWIWEVDNNGRYTFASGSVKEILGYDPEELIGKTPFELMPENEAKRIGEVFKRIVSEKKPIVDLENWSLTKKGKKICLLTNGVPLLDESGGLIGYRGVDKDITEAKHVEEEKIQLQAQLVQAQKIEAIGTLAGGIAHDFNNILAAIIGYAELVKMKLPEDSKFLPNLDQILKSGIRAKTLIQQILAFSRKQELEQKLLQLKYIVKESLKLLRSTLPTDIEIKQDIGKDTGIVNADPTQMQQVIMNLCTNAGHAMQEEGGVLAVGLANVELDDIAAAQYLDMNPGSYLRLSVSDTGHGMTPDVKDRIFEPYFTTKDKGEGTGLGLSVVNGIVDSHGGTITVYSEPGKGSTFHVYLPLIQEEAIKPEMDEQAPILTGNERILFIDDEKALVDLGKQMLEHLGYKVTIRTSSIEALELFKVKSDRFDLVITDMTMPNMTGDKLAKELMKVRPDIPIIICTGYSERISEEKAGSLGIRKFIMKPIVMSDMAKTVREILDT